MTKPHEVLESQGDAVTKGTSKKAEDLSDELLEIDISTVDDKTVRGRVTEVKPISSKILLKAEIPGGESVSERMAKPVPWSTRYKFARIVEDRGYGPGTAHHLEGEEILITRTPSDEWEFKDPKGIDHYWKHYKPEISVALIVAAGVVVLSAGMGLTHPEHIQVVARTFLEVLPLFFMLFMGMVMIAAMSVAGRGL